MAVLVNPDKLRFSLIVAACNDMGIGKDGKLPWDIPKEMQFFKRMTTTTKTVCKKNAVVMGRRTWEGIPQKFRPLRDRINVIVSTTMNPQELPDSPLGHGDQPQSPVKICRTWEEALDYLCSIELSDLLEKVWIIGGNSLYQVAARSPHCEYVYLTRVMADFDCDVFFPAEDIKLEKNFKLLSDKEAEHLGVPTGEDEDNGVTFKYEVYCRRSPEELQAFADLGPEFLDLADLSKTSNPDDCWLKFLGVAKKDETSKGEEEELTNDPKP